MANDESQGRANRPIAIFDSGVGGLSVLRHIRTSLPAEDLLYVADQFHVPYGPRPADQVRDFSETITGYCMERGAKVIVVACNTATAAALQELRATFHAVSFVGMEPAVKPGAETTKTGKVGVLATAGTFESQRYATLMARFASDVLLYENPCTGLVALIEAGHLETRETEELLRQCMQPMLAAGVDTIVLGCTHYPFVLPTIRKIAGSKVTIIDPAPAVARQLQRVLQQRQLTASRARQGTLHAYTTGDPEAFTVLAERLLDSNVRTSALKWQDAKLLPVQSIVESDSNVAS